jgi:archaellum component FlaC
LVPTANAVREFPSLEHTLAWIECPCSAKNKHSINAHENLPCNCNWYYMCNHHVSVWDIACSLFQPVSLSYAGDSLHSQQHHRTGCDQHCCSGCASSQHAACGLGTAPVRVNSVIDKSSSQGCSSNVRSKIVNVLLCCFSLSAFTIGYGLTLTLAVNVNLIVALTALAMYIPFACAVHALLTGAENSVSLTALKKLLASLLSLLCVICSHAAAVTMSIATLLLLSHTCFVTLVSGDALRLSAAAVMLWLAVECVLSFVCNIDIFCFWIAVLAIQGQRMFAVVKKTVVKLFWLTTAIALSTFILLALNSTLASPAALQFATGQWGCLLPHCALLIQTVWLSMSSAAVCEWFATLYSNSWPRRPFVVLMAGGEKLNEVQHVRLIRATSGLALAEDLDAWVQSAFQMLSNDRGNMHEALLIQALKRDFGVTHPLHNLMITPVYDSRLHGLTPEQYGTQLCVLEAEFHTKNMQAMDRQQINESPYAKQLNALYPAYAPKPRDVTRRRMLAAILTDQSTSALEYIQTQGHLAALESRMEAERTEHENRDLEQKYSWLHSQDEFRPRLKDIESALQFSEKLRSVAGISSKPDGGKTGIPIDFRRIQYKTPEDMKGISWITAYALYRAGGITIDTVNQFRSERMGPGESPAQAAARATRLAQIIHNSGVRGFDMDHELRELFTNPDLKGGAFFTKALHDYIIHLVQGRMDAFEREGKVLDAKGERDLWSRTAEEQFSQIRGKGFGKDKEIQYECNNRASINPDGLGYFQPRDAKLSRAKNPPAAANVNTSKPASDKHTNLNKGKLFCSHHQWNDTHTTGECKYLARVALEGQQSGKSFKKALTTTPAAGTDLTTKGSRPNAKYSVAGSGPKPAHTSYGQAKQEAAKCMRCTELCGRPVWHAPDRCFMEPNTPVEEWFNPPDEVRRRVVERKRKAQGMGPLPPFQPRVSAAMSTYEQPASNNHGTRYRAMMMRAPDGYPIPSLSAEAAARIRSLNPQVPNPDRELLESERMLIFRPNSKSFTCRTCYGTCFNRTNLQTGLLEEVQCLNCRFTRVANQLLPDWVNPALWGTTPQASGIDYMNPKDAASVVHNKSVKRESALDAMFSGRPAPFGSSIAPSSIISSSLPPARPVQFQVPVVTGAGASYSRLHSGGSVATDIPYDFANDEQRELFTDIMLDYQTTGGTEQTEELSALLDTLSLEARQFQLGRLQRRREHWVRANSLAAQSPTDVSASTITVDFAAPPSVQPAEQPLHSVRYDRNQTNAAAEVVVGPQPVENIQHAARPAPPLVSTQVPIPDTTAVAPVASQATQTTGSPGSEHANTTFAQLPGGFKNVVPLVPLHDVVDSMKGTLSLDFIPREEHDLLVDRLDRAVQDQVRLKDRIGTLSLVANQSVFGDEKGPQLSESEAELTARVDHIASQVIDQGWSLDSCRADIERLSQQIDDNQADLTEHIRTKVQNNIVESNDRVEALAETVVTLQNSVDSLNRQSARLNAADISGLPDFASFATAESVQLLHERIDGVNAAITDVNGAVFAKGVQIADLVTKVGSLNLTPTAEQVDAWIARAPACQMLHNQLQGLLQSRDAASSTISAAALTAVKESPELAVVQRELRNLSQALNATQAQVFDLAAATPTAPTPLELAAATPDPQVTTLSAQLNSVITDLHAECVQRQSFETQLRDLSQQVQRLATRQDTAPKSELSRFVLPSASQARFENLESKLTRLVKAVEDVTQNFNREVLQNTVHDMNYLWQQIKSIKHAMLPDWRHNVGYSEPTHDALAVLELGSRPRFERPVHNLNGMQDPVFGHADRAARDATFSVASQVPATVPAPNANNEPTTTPEAAHETADLARGRLMPTLQALPLQSHQVQILSSPAHSLSPRYASGPVKRVLRPQSAESNESGSSKNITDSPALSTAIVSAEPIAAAPAARAETSRKSPRSAVSSTPRTSPRKLQQYDYNLNRASDATARGEKPFQPRALVVRVDGKLANGEEVVATLAEYDRREASKPQSILPPEMLMSGPEYLRYLQTNPAAKCDSDDESTSTLSSIWCTPVNNDQAIRAALAATEPESQARHDAVSRAAWPRPAASLLQLKPISSTVRTESNLPTGTDPPVEALADALAAPAARADYEPPSTSPSDKEQEESDLAAPQAKEKRKKRRNRGAKARSARRNREVNDLPTVDARLSPTLPNELRVYFKNGEYLPTLEELERKNEFFRRNSTLVSLDQKDDITSLHIFGPDGKSYATPATILVDTGAEIKMMISPTIARRIGLTWTPNSANLIGIGGTGGGDGYAHQRVVVRMGGFDGTTLDVGPFKGCYTVSIKPLIMKERVVQDIGFEVILGQGFLRGCLASVDSLLETLDYSPAWLTHGCPEFRCSIPCRMSALPSKVAVVWSRLLHGTQEAIEHEPIDNMIVGTSRPQVRDARATSTSPPKQSGVRFDVAGQVLAPGTSDEGEASALDPNASRSNRNTKTTQKAKKAAPFAYYPGFPQNGIPSRREHRDFQDRQSARNRHDRMVADQITAEARARASEKMAHVVPPIGIVYSLKELQASNRLMDGFRLDLSNGQVMSESQLQAVVDRVQERLDPTRRASNPTPVRPAAFNPQPQAPVQVRAPAVPAQNPAMPNVVAGPAAAPPAPAAAQPADVDSPPPVAVRAVIGRSGSCIPRQCWQSKKGDPLPAVAATVKRKQTFAPATPGSSSKGRGKVVAKYGLSQAYRPLVSAVLVSAGFSFLPGARAQVDSGFVAAADYGQDFQAFVLVIVVLANLCMAHKVFTWLVSNRPRGQHLSIVSAVLLLGVSHVAHSHHRYALPDLWLAARLSGLAPYLFWALLSLFAVTGAVLYVHAATAQRRAKAP